MPLLLSENFDEFVGFQNLSDENSYAKVISPRAAAYFIAYRQPSSKLSN
jgi:hypothetical protein